MKTPNGKKVGAPALYPAARGLDTVDFIPASTGTFREILEQRRLSQAHFARVIGESPMRISHVVKGTRPVTAELALLFGRAFGQSPQYWLNLQAAYDLKLAERAIANQLKGVSELDAA